MRVLCALQVISILRKGVPSILCSLGLIVLLGGPQVCRSMRLEKAFNYDERGASQFYGTVQPPQKGTWANA